MIRPPLAERLLIVGTVAGLHAPPQDVLAFAPDGWREQRPERPDRDPLQASRAAAIWSAAIAVCIWVIAATAFIAACLR
jgi:hypothetical protein